MCYNGYMPGGHFRHKGPSTIIRSYIDSRELVQELGDPLFALAAAVVVQALYDRSTVLEAQSIFFCSWFSLFAEAFDSEPDLLRERLGISILPTKQQLRTTSLSRSRPLQATLKLCSRCHKNIPLPGCKTCTDCQQRSRRNVERWLERSAHLCAFEGCDKTTTGDHCREHAAWIRERNKRQRLTGGGTSKHQRVVAPLY